MSAPSAVRISKKDWIPGRFHRRSRATGWAPKVRKTDTLEDGRSILRCHRKALAGVGWGPWEQEVRFRYTGRGAAWTAVRRGSEHCGPI